MLMGGPGGGRHFPLPQHQAGHQLLRAVQCGEEFGRQGDAYADIHYGAMWTAERFQPTSSSGSTVSRLDSKGHHLHRQKEWLYPGQMTYFPIPKGLWTICTLPVGKVRVDGNPPTTRV